MKNLINILFFLFSSNADSGVDYYRYHALINKAEALYFIENNSTECFKVYDKILSEYDFVFVKDFFVAAQIACYHKSKKNMQTYINVCFKNGLRADQLSLSKIFKNNDIDENNGLVMLEYNNLREAYTKKINFHHRKEIYQLYCDDQINKNIAYYNVRLSENMDKFIYFVKTHGFPSDRLIGIDDSSMKVSGNTLLELYHKTCRNRGVPINPSLGQGEDYSLSSCTIIPFLLHHPCSYDKIEPYIYAEIKKGNLHPRDVGLIYDNMLRMKFRAKAKEFSCKRKNMNAFFKLNLFCTYPPNSQSSVYATDSVRKSIGICSVEQDSIKKVKMLEYGFYNSFGFWSCR